jgi:hypothetical protein
MYRFILFCFCVFGLINAFDNKTTGEVIDILRGTYEVHLKNSGRGALYTRTLSNADNSPYIMFSDRASAHTHAEIIREGFFEIVGYVPESDDLVLWVKSYECSPEKVGYARNDIRVENYTIVTNPENGRDLVFGSMDSNFEEVTHVYTYTKLGR